MKRCIIALTLVISLLLCSIPASAVETLSDLKKIYNNLSQYLYKPFFEDSEYYEAYEAELAAVGELLKQETIIQNDIDTHYERIKNAYARMMKDVFDYSTLDIFLKDFEILDSKYFTEESWRKVLSIVDNAKNELDAPSLFQKGKNTTETEYHNITNAHINNFTTDYFYAYNSLEFLPLEENTDKNRLTFFLNFCGTTISEELMGKSRYWNSYLSSVNEANACLTAKNPKQDRLNKAEASLLENYKLLCSDTLDFTPATSQIEQFSKLNPAEYSRNSWKRYEASISKLKTELEDYHFIYLATELTLDQRKLHIQYYFESLALESKKAFEKLISQERFEYLEDLCAENRSVSGMEGLEIKVNRLITRVNEGTAILNNTEATPADIETAIKNLETARSDFELSEAFLLEEQKSVVKQDAATIRLIVLFSVLSLSLSIVFACIVSKRFYGKINWRK